MICAAMQRAYDAHAIACPPRERVLSIVGLSLREAFQRLGEGHDGFPVDGMIEHYKQAFFDLRHSLEHHEPLYPGARETVHALAARDDCLLGIATGKSQRGLRAILTHHELLPYFATLKTADDAPSKPHPGMILEAMREAGTEPHDTLMVGDTTYDMEMARAAGVHAIGVTWGYHPHVMLQRSGAADLVSDFAELARRIDSFMIARAPAERRWTRRMRDIFDDIFKGNPLDPMEAARRNVRPTLRRRFYENAAVAQDGDAYAVTLDGKPVRTPARRLLAAPTRELAQAIADEWQAQKDVIDPAHMPLTRLANSIVDGVADKPHEVRDEIVKYLGSDLLFYRADGPEGLIERQAAAFDPVVRWAADALGARFIMVEGVVYAMQPEEAIAAAARAIPADAWTLGAVHSAMTLTGSALLALALARDAASVDDVWKAAHVDEDWQMEQWGRDSLAMERRAYREAEMKAAATVLRLAR